MTVHDETLTINEVTTTRMRILTSTTISTPMATSRAGESSWRQRARDERGIALLSVLGILSVMLVLASLMATTSRNESVLSGVTAQSARAFAAADAGLGYALSDLDNWTQVGTRCTDLEDAGLSISGDVCVRYIGEGPPPVAVKVSALQFKALNYDVDATGTATPNGSASLEMQAARLGPAQ